MSEQQIIPDDVIAALEEVRASAITNMLDRQRVLFELEMKWAFGAATWLEQNPARYLDALDEMGRRRSQKP